MVLSYFSIFQESSSVTIKTEIRGKGDCIPSKSIEKNESDNVQQIGKDTRTDETHEGTKFEEDVKPTIGAVKAIENSSSTEAIPEAIPPENSVATTSNSISKKGCSFILQFIKFIKILLLIIL